MNECTHHHELKLFTNVMRFSKRCVSVQNNVNLNEKARPKIPRAHRVHLLNSRMKYV
jgi:hypothetical protein